MDDDSAGGGAVEAGDEVEQGGLAGARGARRATNSPARISMEMPSTARTAAWPIG
jgi:hypothetical protein